MAMLTGKSLRAVILLCAFSQNWCQNSTDLPMQGNSTTELIPTQSPNMTNTKNYDYLMKVLFNIQENKIADFLVNTTFTNMPKNVITVSDIVQLYGLGNISLCSTNAALVTLNINPANLLSINGLEVILKEFQITFKNFYEEIFSIKLNISGLPLRNFITALGINNGEFTSAMSYNDPDPFEEFKKGNFSKESIDAALNGTGKTLEDLFAACRDMFLSKVVTLETDELLEVFKKYDFAQEKAVQLWHYLNISTEDVNAIPVFENLLAQAIYELNQKTYLGVLMKERSIAINKKVFDLWKNRPMSKIYAQSIDKSITLEIEQKQLPSRFNNIIILGINGIYNGAIADVGTTPKLIRNCTFITLQNGTVVSMDVHVANYVFPNFEITSNLTEAEFVVGSPLICQNEIYGLAAELLESDTVVFESFIIKPHMTSSALSKVFNRCLVLVSIIGLHLSY
ncbi:uncharacterized protein [Leptinotarsa decemlineata]|uniref:uncharacterized protein n=1 Tax=Leptinotarsa decemlineata TaxID=7539 RepID=UPI003D30D266